MGGGYAGEGTEDKMQGWCCGKKLRGDAGDGKEDKMRGGGWLVLREKFEGVMPKRVKKMKWGGGLAGKNLGGG